MSGSTPTFSTVRITFDPYSHEEVQRLLLQVHKQFGRDKSRWYYISPDVDQLDGNAWVLDFKFRNPHDATLFGLKYQNSYGI